MHFLVYRESQVRVQLKTVFSFLLNTSKVFNLSNGLLIFKCLTYCHIFLSLDFVIDVFMTLETLVKFRG